MARKRNDFANVMRSVWQCNHEDECKSCCWPWIGAVDKGGYGVVRYHGKNYNTHNLLFKLRNGIDLDRSIYTLHSCDLRLCVNWNHIREGTHKENMEEMIIRGRQPNAAKLTEGKVRQIRRNFYFGGWTYQELADIFNVTTSAITHVISSRSWKHLQGEIWNK